MIATVWLMHKPGADRLYTTTVCPDRAQLDAYKRDGYKVFRASILLPIYEESEVPVVTTLAEPVDSSGGEPTHHP